MGILQTVSSEMGCYLFETWCCRCLLDLSKPNGKNRINISIRNINKSLGKTKKAKFMGGKYINLPHYVLYYFVIWHRREGENITMSFSMVNQVLMA